MLKFLYLLSVIYSLVILVNFYEISLNKVNKNILFVYLMTFISNYGYSMYVFSDTLEGLMCGHQVYYIGSLFTLFFLTLTAIEITKTKIPTFIRWGMFILAFVILFLTATISFIDMYYKSVSFAKFGSVSYLKKEYGPLHILLIIYLTMNIILATVCILFAFFKKRQVSTRTLCGMIAMMFVAIISYFGPRLLKIPLEFLPFAYCILDTFLLILVNRMSLYDMSANLISVYEKQQDYGYISFDNKGRFMGCNDFAYKLVPELASIPIDSVVPEDDSFLSQKLIPFLNSWKLHNGNTCSFTINDLSINCSVKYISTEKKNIGYLIELRDETEQKKYVTLLDDYNRQLRSNVEEKSEKIVQIQDSIITGMASMVESRDNSTGGHIKRTSNGVKIFLDQLRKHDEFEWLTDDFYSRMIKSAPMHDLGKIAIDDAVLRKPGKFTPEEYEQMKKHPTEGAQIVLGVLREVDDEELKIIAMNVAHYHHEKWDGTGYPTGKKGEEIPIEARIMAFADVFDALVTKRCYKEAFSYDDAFNIIKKDLGTHFDPNLGKIFLECREELEQMYTLEELINNATNMV